MKRLLYFVDLVPRVPVGGTIWLTALAKALRQKGVEIHAVLSGDAYEKFVNEFQANGGKLILEPAMRNRFDEPAARRILEQVRPDAVCFMFYPMLSRAVLKAARFRSVRRAYYIDQSSKPILQQYGLRKLLITLRGKILGPRYDAIITVSDFKRDRLVQRLGLPTGRIRRIYNGVETDKFDHPQASIAADAPLLYVGQIAGFKGVPTLLAAYRQYCQVAPDAPSLHIAGDGPMREELQQKVRKWGLEDRILFLGQRGDIPRLMMAARLILIPSEWDEACAFVAIEAMLAGRPVIASDAGSLVELLGGHGIIHRAGDAANLADRLEQWLNPENRAGLEARGAGLRQRALAEFNLDKMVAGYTDLWAEIAQA
jgi:glycosyltransferase involved in cell wall biosynthesis